MNTRIPLWIGILATLALAVPSAGGEAEVMGSRVNLRSAPFAEAEVSGQVNQGDRLRVKDWGEAWVEVYPPDSMGVWIHKEFVADGVVVASSLNVRSGPGIAHQQVGRLQQGDAVTVRDSFGDWLQIAPPEGVSVWISRAYVRDVRPPPPPPSPSPPPAPAPAPRPVAPPVSPPETTEASEPRPIPVTPVMLPRSPDDLDWAEDVEQGRVVEREGVVRRVGFLVRRPSRFRLVTVRGGRRDTICYVRGNDQQLQALSGLLVRIRGREYTTRTYEHPVLLADQISVLP